MTKHLLLNMLVAACIALLGGCTYRVNAAANHTMPITRYGTISQAHLSKTIPGSTFDAVTKQHASDIVAAFRASGKDRVILYLHGGLVSLDASGEESDKLLGAMSAEGFPVFINWNTSFGASYGSHLVFRKNGLPSTRLHTWTAPIVVPFRLVLDVVDMVAQAPRAWARGHSIRRGAPGFMIGSGTHC